MKRIYIISPVFFLVILVFISCHTPKNRSNKDYYLKNLEELYALKAKLINSNNISREKELIDSMSVVWNKITLAKEPFISFLLSYEGKKTYELYGNNYQGKYIGKKLQDEAHSLFLIEATIQNNYFFNRRGFINTKKTPLGRFEEINILVNKKDTILTSEMNPYSKRYYLDFSDKSIKKGYEIYKHYYKENKKNSNFNCNSPISNTDMVWYDISYFYYGGRRTEINFNSPDESYRRLYNLDFTVGDMKKQCN